MKIERIQNIGEFLRLGGRPRIIAHRGCSGVCPENTLAAFRKAIEIGADMIELDVLLTRDRRVVVIHDCTLDRTARRAGLVSDYTWKELSGIDFGSWFSGDFRDERLPLLEEVIDLVKGRILLNIEIKTEAVTDERKGGISEAVVRMVRDAGLADSVIISSFDPRALRQAREEDREIKLAVLYNRELQRGLTVRQIVTESGAEAFNLGVTEVTPKVLKQCRELCLPVAVYTVDSPRTMEELIGRGVNAIFTNHPDRMLKLLGEMN